MMEDKSPTTVPTSYESFLGQGDTPQPRDGEVAKTFKRRSNVDLRKSIQLLNEAVSPSLKQTFRTPRGNLRHLSHTPDISNAFKFTPAKSRQSFYQENFKSSTAQEEVTANIGATEMSFADITVTQSNTLANFTLLGDEDPGKKASQELFETFSGALKRNSAPHQVMNLLQDFIDLCDEQVAKLGKMTSQVTKTQLRRFYKMYPAYQILKDEKQTWTLLHCLYKDRLESEERDNRLMEDDGDDKMDKKNSVWALSEQNIVTRLYENDSSVRQSQLVVDWLETCAAEDCENMNRTNLLIEQPIAWENTLHGLQKQKQGVKSSMSRLITEVDPDAPFRQKLSLDDLDQEDEKSFLRNLFQFIRSGQLDRAQTLCQSCGQTWRAATLEGWQLFHDPNFYSSTNVDDVKPVEGNPNRDIWKSVCWGLASEPNLDIFEKATYAALSGNLQAILPVCSSWMDYVWAYFKVMVDTKVEQEVRLHRTVDRTLDRLPPEYGTSQLDPHGIFKDIAASINEDVRLESENWYHIIQKYVILGDVSGLIEVMYSWLQSSRESLPNHLVRLMAHIVLFLRSIGQTCKEELCEAILEAFVEDLIRNKHREVIAHYVSSLAPEAQVQWYATFLEDIEDQEERQKCLRRAEEEDLDVAEITKTVVERIRMRDTGPAFPENSLAAELVITEEDQAKINAVDWLVFDEAHRPEALKQANAIMRSFIAVRKHTAARQVFEKLPTDTIDVIYRQWHLKTGTGELGPSDNNAIREYLCMKAYLDAVESFNDWFNLFHKGQPTQPVGLEGAASFTDRVAFEHKMKQYEQERDRWKYSLLMQTKTTRDRIYNVLLFADGGWLNDACEDPDDEVSRQHQLAQLRKLHLPGLCLNLHTVLHDSGLYPEAVQIADVVASEMHQLYKDFDQESMRLLLAQICKSSGCLLDEGKDPLGYDMV